MKTNNIDEVKEAIKFKIYEKSVLAFKYAFNSNFDFYAKALNNNNLTPFAINRETLRSVDKKCIINGKRTWMYKIAIQELVDEGSLIVSNSYCSAPQHNFSKSYALTVDKLKEVLSFVKVNIQVDDARVEWNESMDFMAGYDVIPTEGKWLTDVYCTKSEKAKQISNFENAAKYAEFCKEHTKKEVSNYYTFEGDENEVIA